MMNRRGIVLIALLVVVAIWVAACGSGKEDETSSPVAETKESPKMERRYRLLKRIRSGRYEETVKISLSQEVDPTDQLAPDDTGG